MRDSQTSAASQGLPTPTAPCPVREGSPPSWKARVALPLLLPCLGTWQWGWSPGPRGTRAGPGPPTASCRPASWPLPHWSCLPPARPCYRDSAAAAPAQTLSSPDGQETPLQASLMLPCHRDAGRGFRASRDDSGPCPTLPFCSVPSLETVARRHVYVCHPPPSTSASPPLAGPARGQAVSVWDVTAEWAGERPSHHLGRSPLTPRSSSSRTWKHGPCCSQAHRIRTGVCASLCRKRGGGCT